MLQEGSNCKAILTTLMQEASTGHGAPTTIRFFAEFARHRGFVGDEIDRSWAYLRERHTHEMAVEVFRYRLLSCTKCTWHIYYLYVPPILLRGTIVNRTYGIHKNLYV